MSKPPEVLPLHDEKEKALGQIRLAWMAGIVSGCLTLILSVGSGAGYFTYPTYGYDGLLDVLIIFGLTFGIYKKSRIASILMLIYFIASKVVEISSPDLFGINPTSSTFFLVSWAFGFAYFQAIRGTFTYHKLKEPEGKSLSE